MLAVRICKNTMPQQDIIKPMEANAILKKLFCFTLILVLCFGLAGCKSQGAKKKPERIADTKSDEMQLKGPQEGDAIAVFTTSKGVIRAVLYPDEAPMAVENFIGLAQQGYFNGITFHRVVENFVVQTGDPTGTGTGGTTIWNGTPFPVEAADALHHYSGALGMAHLSGDAASNTSQFYMVQTPKNSVNKAACDTLAAAGLRDAVVNTYRDIGGAPYLDNLYTVFGQIYEGMDVVDEIAKVKCDENGQPLEAIMLESVQISTYTAAVAPGNASSAAPSAAAGDSSSSNSESA